MYSRKYGRNIGLKIISKMKKVRNRNFLCYASFTFYLDLILTNIFYTSGMHN